MPHTVGATLLPCLWCHGNKYIYEAFTGLMMTAAWCSSERCIIESENVWMCAYRSRVSLKWKCIHLSLTTKRFQGHRIKAKIWFWLREALAGYQSLCQLMPSTGVSCRDAPDALLLAFPAACFTQPHEPSPSTPAKKAQKAHGTSAHIKHQAKWVPGSPPPKTKPLC